MEVTEEVRSQEIDYSELIYIVYNNVEGDNYPVAATRDYEEALKIVRNDEAKYNSRRLKDGLPLIKSNYSIVEFYVNSPAVKHDLVQVWRVTVNSKGLGKPDTVWVYQADLDKVPKNIQYGQEWEVTVYSAISEEDAKAQGAKFVKPVILPGVNNKC